jgi:mevalonate kinase
LCKSHASIDPAIRASRKLPEDLIRLCVGIEDIEDLIEDLEMSLLSAGAIEFMPGTTKLRKSLSLEEKLQELIASNQSMHNTQSQSEVVGGNSEEVMIASAPGKVILFGEHAVVYGVEAIAGSIDLRCFGMVRSSKDGKVGLELKDADLEIDWEIQSLPWDLIDQEKTKSQELNLPLVTRLEQIIAEKSLQTKIGTAGIVMFLYLWMSIRSETTTHSLTGQQYSIRSSIPIGSGLGSSAAISVCLSSLIAYSNGLVPLPSTSSPIPQSQKSTINHYAFMAEKIIHGNPSGVDNSVSTFGGAISFRRDFEGIKGEMEGLSGFKEIRFLVTDTRVPKDTKALVAKVAKKRGEVGDIYITISRMSLIMFLIQEPEVVKEIMEDIRRISKEAKEALIKKDVSRGKQIETLEVGKFHVVIRNI